MTAIILSALMMISLLLFQPPAKITPTIFHDNIVLSMPSLTPMLLTICDFTVPAPLLPPLASSTMTRFPVIFVFANFSFDYAMRR